MYLPQAIRTALEQEREHAAFLDLDLTIEDNIFVYKLFDKKGKFSFFLLYFIFSLEQYSTINILWFNIFRVPTNSLMYTKTDSFFA